MNRIRGSFPKRRYLRQLREMDAQIGMLIAWYREAAYHTDREYLQGRWLDRAALLEVIIEDLEKLQDHMLNIPEVR